MARGVADTGAAAVLMHNRESVDPELDTIADILGFLSRSIDIALTAGIERRRVGLFRENPEWFDRARLPCCNLKGRKAHSLEPMRSETPWNIFSWW
jgi:hypothetical protein